MKPLALLATTVLASLPTTLSAQALTSLEPNQTLLEIQATGEVFVAPDQAAVTGGVVTFAPTSREAADANAREMRKLVDALRAAGVDARDIQTQNLSLNPQFNYNRSDGAPPDITGYQANNNVIVRVRDVKKAADLLTVMFEAGANNVYGPNFGLTDSDAAIAAARLDAVANARQQAQTYADAFGMRIVKVARISERGNRAEYGPIVVTSARLATADVAPPPPPPSPVSRTSVQIGEMQQVVTVFVDYVLEPK